MSELDSRIDLESEGEVSLGAIRSLVRFAPLLILILSLSSCKKDPELANCQVELARLEGILSGVGIDDKSVEVDDLQACHTSMARVEGIMRGAAMRSDDVRVKLEAMGVEASFNLPGAKKYPGLSGGGGEDEKPKPKTAAEKRREEIEAKRKVDEAEEVRRIGDVQNPWDNTDEEGSTNEGAPDESGEGAPEGHSIQDDIDLLE
ncbi:MAG: hypothetical protein O3B47_01510 [bacterium]|nr:hypothetical protein [bacterium]